MKIMKVFLLLNSLKNNGFENCNKNVIKKLRKSIVFKKIYVIISLWIEGEDTDYEKGFKNSFNICNLIVM